MILLATLFIVTCYVGLTVAVAPARYRLSLIFLKLILPQPNSSITTLKLLFTLLLIFSQYGLFISAALY
uniref:Uncharacterized protein n=1 Tax=Tolypothrix bouteillei VB521301 TaxID=1479485 RepID=A0A0C1RA91_9CYAN